MARRHEDRRPLPRRPGWRDIPDEFWALAEPLLPRKKRSKKGGRPPNDQRQVLNGILYVLRTGCQWKMSPREYGSGSTLHEYFQRWTRKGVFRKLWRRAAAEYDRLKGLDWDWQAIDSVSVQAPVKGGISQGKTRPTGRSSARSGITMLRPGASRWQRYCRGRTVMTRRWSSRF